MNFKIVRAFPSSDVEAAWRQFLPRADYASHYTTPEFFREPFFENLRPFALLVFDGLQVVTVVTGIHQGHFVECGLLSRPQVAVDLSADQGKITSTIAAGLAEESAGAELLTLYSYSPLAGLEGPGYRMQPQEGVIMLDSKLGADALWKKMDGTRRTHIRKALSYKLEIAPASTDAAIAEFYPIYVQWCELKEQPWVSLETLQRVYSLRNNRMLLTARHEGRMIAGSTLRFVRGGLVEYSANASYKDSQFLKPNDVLMWKCIEWACQENFPQYSMGGAHRFLRKYGGALVPVYRYRLDKTLLKRHELQESLTGKAREIYRALPEPVRQKIRSARGKTGE